MTAMYKVFLHDRKLVKDTDRVFEDFINKTFNVVYRVSPPIISDWKNYFALMWKHAFGEDAVIDENITKPLYLHRKYHLQTVLLSVLL